MFLAQMRKELCWHNTLMQPVRGMIQRSNVNSSRSYKICEVYIYKLIYYVEGTYISGKNWLVSGHRPREQFIAKWADLYLYLDLSFSTGLLDFYFSFNGAEKIRVCIVKI